MDVKDPLVIEDVKIRQGIIERLANNSNQCKQWCVGLVTALLAFAAKRQIPFSISFVPIILFYFLDSYYLGLNRNAWRQIANFLWKVENNKYIDEELFLRCKFNAEWKTDLCETIPRCVHKIISTIKAALSLSTLPFYLMLIVFVILLSGKC